MKHLLSIVLFLFCLTSIAQTSVESCPSVPNDRNWISSIGYDFSGATISKSVSFFNDLGKGTQRQRWDVLTGRVWAIEARYDYFNRPALQSLSAPINSTATFGYNSNFILSSSGTPLNINQYDTTSTLFNPTTISSNPNSLGWYYSSNNILDKYQDVTSYPYSRTVYSELNPGTVRAVIGGNKINGEWLQGYSFSMPKEINNSSSDDLTELTGKKIIKTISRGVDGIESVVFADTDGKTLGVCRSGNEDLPSRVSRQVYSEIIDKGYVDIHIPVGCDSGNNVSISNVLSSNHSIKIYNLITETLVTTTNITNDTSLHLDAGFYRVEDVNNYYGLNNTSTTSITPIRISYTVNYYDYSLNQYDEYDRLIISTQPQKTQDGNSLQSTYQYDTLGQLVATNSPDEGSAQFKYRNDGQIRFSQNAEQAKVNSFSYTNYDDLGRPIESGVYTGNEIFFSQSYDSSGNAIACVDTILDELDSLPQDGRSEQTFSVYDLPDPDFKDSLVKCNLPYASYNQMFVSGNVSYTYTQNPDTAKTWYSYDVYGRVVWMIQQMPGLCLKTIDYSYSPINGELIKVDYQKYKPEERFIHQYTYNIAGQLTDVHTSLDNTTFTRQAHYIYNESGALTRTELADNLQGVDYVYNLGGQLKAINHPSILSNQDPGGDGMPGSGFAADVFGMAIDYYNGDYTRTGTPKPITTTPQGTDQYNGNIKAIRWNTQVPNTTLNAYTYRYNKNNWLSDATFGSADLSANIINNPNNDYKEGGITYDANGNIQTLLRNGYTDSAGSNNMDNLTYHYSSSLPNRLLNVRDNADNADTNRYSDIRTQDIGVNTGSTTTAGANISTTLENYLYNDLGQLTTNLQDKIFYDYNASGLVTKIGTLVDDNNAEDYKTIYFNNYDTFTSNNHGWVNVGVFDNSYFTLGINSSCNELTDATDYNNTALQINGKITARKFFKTTANTTFKLNLDVIIDNLLQDPAYSNPLTNNGESSQSTSSDGGTGSELPPSSVGPTPPSFSPVTLQHPTVTVNLKRPDGTIIYTQTATGTSAQSPNYCGRYFPTHIDTGAFTTTTEQYVILELVVSNELANTTSNNNKSKYQITYLDNLKLEVGTKTKVAFYYNDRGERSKKESYLDNGNVSSTYYVRDASGNVMGIYNSLSGPTVRFAGEPRLVEYTIYGNSRIGIFKRTDKTSGYALYELTDHLGNVRAVIQKTATAIYALTNKTDYYPFGMPMPNKTTTDGNYRYAFQGQEKDPETGMEAFELRLWDGRLGRWLTVDPKHQYASPYLGMGNNPISRIDPDGGDDWHYDEAGNLIGDKGDNASTLAAFLGSTLEEARSIFNHNCLSFDSSLEKSQIFVNLGKYEGLGMNSEKVPDMVTNSTLTAISISSDLFRGRVNDLSKLKTFEAPNFNPEGSYEFRKIASGINDGKIYAEGTAESLQALNVLAKTARGISYGAGTLGFILSVKDYKEKKISGELLALDGVMTVVSYCGPIGAGLGAVYFIFIRTSSSQNAFPHYQNIEDLRKVQIDNVRVHLNIHRFQIQKQ